MSWSPRPWCTPSGTSAHCHAKKGLLGPQRAYSAPRSSKTEDMWRNENERPGGLVGLRTAVIGCGAADGCDRLWDWQGGWEGAGSMARHGMAPRLMTSKADHHRPLPPRHSPPNPSPLIFKGPLCPLKVLFRPSPPPLCSVLPSSSSVSGVGAAVLPECDETIRRKLFKQPQLPCSALFCHCLPVNVTGTE